MWKPSKMQHIGDVPKEALNWRLLVGVICIGFLGATRGLDEGIISGEMQRESFQTTFDIEEHTEKESNVVAMVQLFSVVGAVVGYLTCDRFGRVRSSQICCLLMFLGTSLWIGANNIAMLYVGRAINGIGVGMTPVCAPVFLVEIAPRQIRGLCTSVYSASVYVGLLLGYSINLAVKRHMDDTKAIAWQVPLIMNYGWHAIILVGTFFIHESPRWLMQKERHDDAAKSLAYYRQMEPTNRLFAEEFELIADSVRAEKAALTGFSFMDKVRELFGEKNNQYKLMIAIAIQIFGQYTGAGAISTYANRILTIIGVDNSQGYVTSVGFGTVKLAAGVLSSFFLIDLLGRRRTLLGGVVFQGLSNLYMAIFLSLYIDGNHTKGKKAASEAAIAAIFVGGAAWSAGGNLAQYLINTEIFGLRVRSLASAFIMALHYLLQYSVTRALTPMLNSGLKAGGTFAVFCAASLACSLPFYLFFLPETSGKSLETIDEIFDLPWYKIGRASRRPIRGEEVPSHSMPAALESGAGWSPRGDSSDELDTAKDEKNKPFTSTSAVAPAIEK
ncbi:uncharacterized protein PFL1_00331 [Pseudozyma flocculosa PF-1]|uniref:Related to Quinate permease n=1 Tax=Pseudozyma flocculosa TaxID=84751 RepID=A0A5C3EUX8_9BASI|nr:uncharacterized protein PFL1_00331 [Pseudozyma flocculosa PF-1]EPQ32134.1 hypothetical protein PFL1_00331 [Pseudozyma flocculosa PF-1]SPO34929.1 related to Quinate permease [Pseudozyma flocculosa]